MKTEHKQKNRYQQHKGKVHKHENREDEEKNRLHGHKNSTQT